MDLAWVFFIIVVRDERSPKKGQKKRKKRDVKNVEEEEEEEEEGRGGREKPVPNSSLATPCIVDYLLSLRIKIIYAYSLHAIDHLFGYWCVW